MSPLLTALSLRFVSRRLHALARDRGASTAVEFSLVLPIMLALMLGTVEIGQAMWTQTALNMAVQSAARCASISAQNCGTPAQVATYASQHAGGLALPTSAFTFTTPACGVQVAANYAFTPFTQYIPLSFTLRATTCYPNWANATNP
jgi:Flp pilus assembly protein TadG